MRNPAAASCTYTYLLASGVGREAVIIDPVKVQLYQYLTVIADLDLKLVTAIDTHTHADHITALGSLRDAAGCVTFMGQHTRADCVSYRVTDGEVLKADGIELRALFMPGHTNESFSFVLEGAPAPAVFTGDVLLIRGSRRTDFQGGDARASWHSIVNTLFRLPDETTVYPAHDYKGWTASSIGEERQHNPRLANKTEEQYIDFMHSLVLPNPAMKDLAIPANLSCGRVSP